MNKFKHAYEDPFVIDHSCLIRDHRIIKNTNAVVKGDIVHKSIEVVISPKDLNKGLHPSDFSISNRIAVGALMDDVKLSKDNLEFVDSLN